MKKVIFITGATASGKSEIAIWLALKINGEIINADSRQVYKYLNIGSGKISEKEKKIVKHYLLDIAHPKRSYSLGKWLKDVDEVIKKIYRKNKVPIICGGTILYLKALKEGWVLPNVKPNYKLRKELEKFSTNELYEILLKLDPERAKTIQKENKRRLIRAIEIATLLGKVPSLKKEPKYEILVVAPYVDFRRLERKIYKRLIKRVKGIIQEIKKLRKLGLSLERIISFGLEYRWFGKYVKGEIDLKTAIEKCYKDIRRFAKKQINELKKLNYVYWFKNKKELLKIVKNFLKNEN
ncbi:MAG: tRNA (adenosine(37)-N6)-dimethylallyltransferase MiaA [Minisyncoccia bacterium]|jgi:tRNA dimethylallyltransferase